MLLSEGKRRIVEDLVISTFMYQEDPLKQDEKVALLARQAYLFNQKYRGQMLNEVDEVLRRAVNTPYFSPILRGHEDEVSTVAFSPDSKLFASGSFDGTVRLWDLEQKKSTVLSLDLKSRIKPPPEPGDVLSGGVLSIAFSPDGQTLAVGCGDGTVRLLNPNQPSPKPTVLTGHKGEVWAIAFSPDGKKLASGSWDKTVRLWDLEDLNKTPTILKNHEDLIWSVAFSPNRETLAVGCLDGTVWLWDLHEPIKRWPILSTHEEHLHKLDKKEQQKRAVFSLAFCRDKDGKDCLAASCNDGKVRSWDLNQLDTVPKDAKEDTKNPKVLVSKENMLRAVMAFSRNEQSLALESLAVGFDDGTISLWKRDLLNVDLNVVVVEKYSLKGHSRGVSSLAFSPDGQWLVSGSWGKDSNWDNDTTVRLWDLRPPAAEPIILQEHGDKVVTVAFSPDGKKLASGSYDQTTRLWDLSRLEEEPISLKDHEEGNVNSVAFSPDGNLLASGNAQGEVRLWDSHDRNKVFQPLYDCGQEVSSVAFRPPDGKILAAGSHGNKVLLWDLSNPDRPESLPSLEGHKDKVSALAFSPDGKILASGSCDSTVRLWHLDSPDAPPIVVPPLEGAVSSLAFSPERQGEPQMLAIATDKQTIQLWDVSLLQESPDAEPVFLSEYASFKGLSVAFSPDGQILASGTQKGAVWLWDLRQPDVDPIVLEGHTQAVRTLAFSPDSQWLASGSDDKTIRLWIFKTETIADMVCQKVWRNLTQVEWNEFVGESIPYELTCANLPPGEGVLADERIDILKREFDYKLSRLLEGQKSLLELITEQKREMSEEEIATALRKPKLDEGALARLSALCRLGFILKNLTDPSSIKYSLSPRYLRYLQNR
jgi:WD40 repeat protein